MTNPATESATAKPRFVYAIATSLGLGYLPKAPGTWGSVAGVVLVAVIAALTRSEAGPGVLVTEFMLVLALAIVGFWASERVVESTGGRDTDPSYVVIDEVSGQAFALVTGIVLNAWTTVVAAGTPSLKTSAALAAGLLNWKYLLLGFILFRGFDIWKPPPARQAESLPGGLGIMADDWIAGGYAALLLWLARHLGI